LLPIAGLGPLAEVLLAEHPRWRLLTVSRLTVAALLIGLPAIGGPVRFMAVCLLPRALLVE
jgi:hypothetical protein